MYQPGTHRGSVAADLSYLSSLLKQYEEIPLHQSGTIEITYCVIEGDEEQRARAFYQHCQELRAVAQVTATNLQLTDTQVSNGNWHRRAQLTMPNGTVTYTVLWIEKALETIGE